MNHSWRRIAWSFLPLLGLGCHAAEPGNAPPEPGQANAVAPSDSAGRPSAIAAPAGDERVYVGTFTGGRSGSRGVYLLEFDPRTGRLGAPRLAGRAESPSFLALHPNQRFLYCVNEVDRLNGRSGGAVSAFAIDPSSGTLRQLNQEPSAGQGPTHLSIDPSGRAVLVANYTSGGVAVLPVRSDGSLGPPASIDQHLGRGTDPSRQEGPHAHSIYPSPDDRFALSCDLGLDRVYVYRFDPAAGSIRPNTPPWTTVDPGAGPRHLAFAPSGKYVYADTEMACMVEVFRYDAGRGTLEEVQDVPTLPPNFKGVKSTAEILVHPSGRFLYVSNRGDANSVTVFSIHPSRGTLTPIQEISTQGRTPRGMGIDETGRWLLAANQDTDNVVVFRIDPQTGRLTPAGVNVHVPTPVSFVFVKR